MLRVKLKPLCLIPQHPYDIAKKALINHPILHLFLHNTFCRINCNHHSNPSYYDLKKQSNTFPV